MCIITYIHIFKKIYATLLLKYKLTANIRSSVENIKVPKCNKLGLNNLLIIIYYSFMLILNTVHFKRMINFILRMKYKKFNQYKYFILFFILLSIKFYYL